MHTDIDKPRPVRLEVNRTGLWREVAEFDAGDAQAELAMRTGVESIASMDNSTAFRVITCDGLKNVLLTYSARHGWVTR